MTVDAHVEKCRFSIKAIINGYFVADQRLKLLKPLIDDERIYRIWDGTEGVQALIALRMALFSSIISEANALFFDQDKRAASLSNVMRVFENPGALKKIKTEFCGCSERMIMEVVHVGRELSPSEQEERKREMKREHEKDKALIFESTLPEVFKGFELLITSELSERVRTARDKILQHKEIRTVDGERELYEPSALGLKWSDAEELLELAMPLIFNIELLLNDSSYAIKDFLNSHERASEQFWGKLNG